MSDKTLGEIACEAYSNEVSKAEPGHKAWEAAAEAVLHFAEAEWKPVIEAEAAVIDAARKLNRIWPTADFGSAEWLCARDDFHEAVEAMQAARGGYTIEQYIEDEVPERE